MDNQNRLSFRLSVLSVDAAEAFDVSSGEVPEMLRQVANV